MDKVRLMLVATDQRIGVWRCAIESAGCGYQTACISKQRRKFLLLYCIPTTISSVLNCARIPAAERLEEPLPNCAFSSTVTRKPRSASRTAISALVVPPPPIMTTCSAEEERSIKDHPPLLKGAFPPGW